MLSDLRKVNELQRLARSCIVQIPKFVAQQNASLFGALLRLNFFACYHSKSVARKNLNSLLITSTIAIQSSSAPQVRLEGLKLLGVVLSSLEGEEQHRLDMLPDGFLGKMIASIKAVSNMDSDRTCRELAGKLVVFLGGRV